MARGRGIPTRTRQLHAVLTLAAAITATSCDSVKVVNVGVATVMVSPASTTLAIDETTQLTARAVDEGGNELSGRTPQWTSTNPGIATVSATGSVRGVGPGTATIRASIDGRTGSAQVSVLAEPSIELTVTNLAFGVTQGSDDAPSQTVVISNGGGGDLTGLSVSVAYEGSASGWLEAVLSTTTAPAQLRVTAQMGDLAPGSYRGTITISSPVAEGGSLTIFVVLDVSEQPPAISLDPASLGFSAIKGEGDPQPRNVDIVNGGPGTLSGLVSTVLYDGAVSGWLDSSLSGTTAPTRLMLQPRTGSLTEGVYSARVRLTAPAASNSPQYVNVTFTIGKPPPTDVELLKSGPDTIGGDALFEYVVTVKNNGPALALGVVVRDSLPEEVTYQTASHGGSLAGRVVTWPAIPQLAVGDSAVRRVTVMAPDSGQVVNVASSTATTEDPVASNNDGTAPANQVTTFVNPLADIDLLKSGPDSVNAAEDFTYTIQIVNRGPSTAKDIVVTDVLPAEVTFVSASFGATPNASGNIVWPLVPELRFGQTALFQVTVTAPDNPPAIPLVNTARSTSATDDPNAQNNNGNAALNRVVTTVHPVADLALVKSGPARVNAGSPMNYTITVANDGPSDATGVVVTDVIPSGAGFVSATNGGVASGGVITWPALTLLAGDTIVRSATMTAPPAGPAVNVAAASATMFDPDLSNNDGSNPAGRVSTTINRRPVMTIGTPSNNAVFTLGASVTFVGSGSDPEDGTLPAASLAWTSNQDGGIGVGTSFNTSALSAGAHTIRLTGVDSEGATGSASVSIRINILPVASITSIGSGGIGTPFVEGRQVDFVGSATDADGTVAISWTSSLDGQIGTASSFSTNGLSVGTHEIVLTVTDNNGAVDADTTSIVVNANTPPTAKIDTPTSDQIFQQGASVDFTSTVSDAEDGTPSVSWVSSLDGQFGTTPSFLTTGLSAGTHVVTLTAIDLDGAQAQDQVTIRINAPPTALITQPTNSQVFQPGDNVSFAATINDPDDPPPPSLVISWVSSLDGQIGTTASFSTTTLSVGTHVVTLTVTDDDGAQATSQVTIRINALPVASITSIESGGSGTPFVEGRQVDFVGSATDADGTVAISWTSSLDGQIGTASSFSTNGLSVGTHEIVLTVTDNDGAVDADTTSIVVNANTPPTAAITQPIPPLTVAQGTNITFTGEGSDSEDGPLIGTSLSWSSNLDGAIGTGVTFSRTDLSVGEHTITLTATDSDGASGTAQIIVTIT